MPWRERADEKLRDPFAALSNAEQELHRQHAQLASIYHTAPIGLAFVDPAGYLTVDDSLAAWNGLPAKAHIERTCGQVLPRLRTVEPSYLSAGDSSGSTGQSMLGQKNNSVGNGTQLACESVSGTNRQGRVLGVNRWCRDLRRTAAPASQARLAHASRLAVAGRTASIAHEINQPLGAILSNVDAAEMSYVVTGVAR